MSTPSPSHPHLLVGIDLGGTKVHAGLAEVDGTLLADLRQPTSAAEGTLLVDQLVGLVQELCQVAGVSVSSVGSVGVGAAGVPLDGDGRLRLAPNLSELSSLSLGAELREALGCVVAVENDANVAALGELAAGVGLERRDFAFISVGTGIGMGLVLDGHLVRGAQGGAGEIGYLPIGADPFHPAHQGRGALESAVAGDAFAALYPAATNASEVFAAAATDPVARSVLDGEARWIAMAISAVEAVAAPGYYVLGGGIGSRTELLDGLRVWLARLGRPELEVSVSRLGASAPILGAVRLAHDALIHPHEGVPA